MHRFISTVINETLLQLNEEEINNYLVEVAFAVKSFIPQSGVYNALTSNNNFDLIKSDKVKWLLINLYDYQYKTY